MLLGRNYYLISQRKFKVVLLFCILCLISVTLLFLKFDRPYYDNIDNDYKIPNSKIIHRGRLPQIIIPEKYNEHDIKTRLMEDKIKYLKAGNLLRNETVSIQIPETSPRLHIFYNPDIKWFTTITTPITTPAHSALIRTSENHRDDFNITIFQDHQSNTTRIIQKPIATAYYPYLGHYKPLPIIIRKQFRNLKNCGIGVIILDIDNMNLQNTMILENIFNLAPKFNISITFQIQIHESKRTLDDLREKLTKLSKYMLRTSFYRIYSIKMKATYPLIYVKDAYKLQYCNDEKLICSTEAYSGLYPNIILIGQIRLKEHAEQMRRLCFHGFYTGIPSNGAYYASTWKNWSYFNRFANKYNMLFIPTVGPGYRNIKKLPRHGDLNRDRSNGQYYGYAWRTAIINHVGFITIDSYNNWQDGTQIEEATPKLGYDDYQPGAPKRYLDLTAYWVNNFLMTKNQLLSQDHENCYNFLNNTIC